VLKPRDRNEDPGQLEIAVRSFTSLFRDIKSHFPQWDYEQDVTYLIRRIREEGSNFFLQTLPVLGKEFERSLITGEALKPPYGWKLTQKGRPVFLSHLIDKLWDDEGRPLECMDAHGPEAFRAIRQVTMLYSKVVVDSSGKEEEVLKSFKERITGESGIRIPSDLANEARRLLRVLFYPDGQLHPMLVDYQRRTWGRHGPGAVAGGEKGVEKWSPDWWPGLPRDLFSWEPASCYKPVRVHDRQPPARVITVPKDFRGPRVICIEPKEQQFAQQGLMSVLYGLLMQASLTCGDIDFVDSSLGARMSSADGYSTIDLKDASDHIHIELIRLLFPRHLYKLLTRFRTRELIISGERCKSRCFATMGSAVCFPVETLVFWVLARAQMNLIKDSWPQRSRKYLKAGLRVFGDDVVCPIWAYDAITEAYQSCGFVINTAKSCHMTPVRESCGAYTVLKRDCTVVRPRMMGVSDQRSWCAALDYAIEASNKGLHALSAHYLDLMNDWRPFSNFKIRWSKALHRLEVRVPVQCQTGRRAEMTTNRGLYAWVSI
jgi:hypothetical protein